MKNRRTIKFIATLASVGLMIAFMGNACSEFKTASNGDPSSSGIDFAQCSSSVDFTTLPGAATVAIVYGDQVLENMQACTALAQPSIATLDANAERLGSFSKYGYAGDVTSALMMATAALASEVCDDLVDQEANLATTARRIYSSVDFNMNALNDSAIEDVATRMSRSCWGRMPASEELTIIREEVNAMGTVSNRLRAVSICTSVLASLDGIRQ